MPRNKASRLQDRRDAVGKVTREQTGVEFKLINAGSLEV
jgi:hypothetical protein